MYQVVHHALADPNNKTKFTLIFANVTPEDILLKSEFDALKAKHPDTFNVIYTVDKADANWKGPTGYVNKTLLQQHIPPASLADKVKIMVCGPPGQVIAIAGKKDGMKQGSVGGVLKELGYTEEQVSCFPILCLKRASTDAICRYLSSRWGSVSNTAACAKLCCQIENVARCRTLAKTCNTSGPHLGYWQ